MRLMTARSSAGEPVSQTTTSAPVSARPAYRCGPAVSSTGVSPSSLARDSAIMPVPVVLDSTNSTRLGRSWAGCTSARDHWLTWVP